VKQTGTQRAKPIRRWGLTARLTWAFVLLAGTLVLIVGLVLTIVSYNALVNQTIVRQQKTAEQAALVASAYLAQGRDVLSAYGRVSSISSPLLRSMEIQQSELNTLLNSYAGLFEGLTLLDSKGNELAKVSPFHTFLPQELKTQAPSVAFQHAIMGEVYTDNQTWTSPYSSLPVITMAGPVQGGALHGVLMADVSIKGMWDAIAQVEVGKTGYVYIVDLATGKLIAHSDLSRYWQFQGQSLISVPIVGQLMAGRSTLQHRYQGLEGEPVIGAFAPFADTDWALIVELPTREALAGVRQMIYLLGVSIVLGAVVAGGLGLIVPRRIVRPLSALQEGARQIGSGHLDHVIEIRTGDEIQDLSETFNQMASSLNASYAELERWAHELEDRVEERTQELAKVSERMERRATQLQISTEVAHAITSVRGLDQLLPEIARLISERFGWYHVGIFLLDEAGEYAVLRAANSEGGQRMLARGHRLKVGEVGIVGNVTASGLPRIALDVGKDAVYFDNPDLHGTRSEMALPLKAGDPSRVIGALDVQSTTEAAYEEEDVALLSNLAGQVAVAIENSRLFEQSQEALEEVRKLQRRYVQREWAGVTAQRGNLVYEYRRTGTAPITDLAGALPEVAMALTGGDVVALSDLSKDLGALRAGAGDVLAGAPAPSAALAAPIKLREQVIGVLDLQEADRPRYWTEDEIALVKAISDQVALALENARLLEAEQEQRKAAEALREAAVVLSSTLAFEELIQRMLDQIGQVIPGDTRNLMFVEGDQARVANHMGYERFNTQDVVSELQLSIDASIPLRHMKDTGQPLVVPDALSEPEWVVLPQMAWLRSYVGAPIMVRGQLVGVLNVESATPGFFSQKHASQLEAFASQAAIALENTRLVEETSRRAEQLATLHRIGLAITSALDLDQVLHALYERIRTIMDADCFYVALYDDLTATIEFPLLINGPEGRIQVKPRSIYTDPEITGYIIQSRVPLHVPDLEALPEDTPFRIMSLDGRRTRSYLGVPLIFREQVFGVLSAQSYEANAYTTADAELLTTIASQASIAIQNARAYERLVQTADELREVDRLKNQFLANMSHELRTPLNSIIGFSRVMLKGIDGPLTESQEADLSSIYGSGQHLLNLINSILDMSKIEAGKMDLSFEEVFLHDILNGALATARGLLKDRPIELRSDIPEDLPTAWADAQRIRQVLINLVSNAAKFTEKGYVTLRVEAGPEFVTVHLSDTGIGIEPDAQRRLFIPFQQVDASTARRAGGTGLGLAISRSFVEMHGGQIWVESEPGRGSTFSFTLPVYQAMREKEKAETEIAPEAGKKVVLAVDDDAGVITLLKRYLETAGGYQVIGVRHSHQALETAQRLAPELSAITLDVVMPHMDGWQVLRALKQDPRTKEIPVILCSIVDGLDQGFKLGAAACLSKPVTRDELLEAVRKVERSTTTSKVEPASNI
jgi:signal transduction histidine kinase/ActR/RegA family two-component response regulator